MPQIIGNVPMMMLLLPGINAAASNLQLAATIFIFDGALR
jgi:hypothetical protein